MCEPGLSFDILGQTKSKKGETEMRGNTLTPLKPEWQSFTTELVQHLRIYDCDDGCWNSHCDGSFKITRNLLENRFPDFDIDATIEYFKKSHWFCDCGVFCESPMYLGNPEPLEELNAP